MIKPIGYTLLGISCLLFLAIPVVPWLNISASQIALTTTILIIAGEVLFYLSIFLIGKSFLVKIKNKLMSWKSKVINGAEPHEGNQS
ncbi:MAG: transporter suffix domain-containing protein [Tenuifilaceae bacterium]